MSHNCSEAIEDEIKVCAYFIWEQEGKPVGRALDHWLQAELQLACERARVPVISAHPLRHTAATLLLNERGANLRDVQD